VRLDHLLSKECLLELSTGIRPVQIETHLVGALVGLSVTTSRVVKGFGPSSRVSHRRLTVFSSVLKELETTTSRRRCVEPTAHEWDVEFRMRHGAP
jgi:hypothetical protein